MALNVYHRYDCTEEEPAANDSLLSFVFRDKTAEYETYSP